MTCLVDNFIFRTTRLATFPEYLWIQLRKFDLAADWTPVKLDVAVEIPQTLDLSFAKAKGKQPDEVSLPEQPSGLLLTIFYAKES